VLDLRTGKAQTEAIARIPYTEVEVDGLWYAPRIEQPVAGYISTGPGQRWDKYTTVRLVPANYAVKTTDARGRPARVESDPGKMLKLPAGKHTIRVACSIGGTLAVSNAVEIVVAEK
jgi:hypothetical protein